MRLPSGSACQRRAQMVGAMVVSRQRGAEPGLHHRWRVAGQAGQALQGGQQEEDAAHQRGDRVARQPEHRHLAQRGRGISGLPGRMAIFQKSTASPRLPSADAHQVVVADAGAADGHQHVHAAAGVRGGGQRARGRPAPSAAAPGSPPPARTRAASAWALELTMPPGGIGFAGQRHLVAGGRMATRGRRWTGARDGCRRRARPMSRAFSRRPAATRIVADGEILPGAADLAARFTASRTVTRSPSRGRRPPAAAPHRRRRA